MIKSLRVDQIPEIAKIHAQSLKNDFLPTLGEKFLETLYQGVFDKDGIYGYVFDDKGKVAGFVIGTKNMDRFFKTALKSKFVELSVLLFLKILQKPILVKKVIETFLYPQKEKGAKAELIVIAVLNKWQGKGIGRKLVKVLEKRLRNEKIKRYKVTVYAEKRAVSFYEKLKFVKIADFNLYNKLWYIYEKKIS